jgi:hypothetical protein
MVGKHGCKFAKTFVIWSELASTRSVLTLQALLCADCAQSRPPEPASNFDPLQQHHQHILRQRAANRTTPHLSPPSLSLPPLRSARLYSLSPPILLFAPTA